MTYSTGPGVGEDTVFQWNGTNVAAVISIEPPEVDRAMVDKTCLGDTQKTQRPSTLTDVKTATLKVLYSHTNHNVLVAAQSATSTSPCKIIYFDQTGAVLENWAWSAAYVKTVKLTGAVIDQNIEADITVQFESLPVLTANNS